MWKKFAVSVLVLGYLGSVNAQDEAPPANSGPIQSKKEAKGKKAVPPGGDDSDSKGSVSISASAPVGNPMLTVGQKKIEKKALPKPAGEADKKTPEEGKAPKNSAMMGLGYTTTLGLHLNVEIQNEDIKRSCQMNLPNLFFCIPASLRDQGKKEEKTPVGINEARFPVKFLRDSDFFRSAEDKIDLKGTQFLGLVDIEENPFRR